MSDAQSTTLLGDLLVDRYRLEHLLGRGGMAAVYRARDEQLGRVVAVKIISSSSDDASAVRRERAEIALLASMNHHALVTLFDAGTAVVDGSERTYLVMELVDGPTLAARIADGPLAPIDVCRMAVDLAEGLGVVHSQGVVHRDIKPANVLLNHSPLPSREFSAKLADFGIAHLIDSTRLTAAGGLIGTAAYLSPEQARGAPPAPASDVYSLGLVLLESLTLTRAFPGSLMESISARLVGDPPIPRSLDDGWRSLLAAMTARAPADRPSALEVAAAARQLEHDVVSTLSLAASDLDATRPLAAPAATQPLATPGATDASGVATQLLDAGPSGSTAVMSPALAARLDRASRAPDPVPERLPDGRAPTARRRRLVLAVAGAAILVAAAVGVVRPLVSDPGSEPPVLPAVVEPLGTHLDELMSSVSP